MVKRNQTNAPNKISDKKKESLVDVIRREVASNPEVKNNLLGKMTKLTTAELVDDLKKIRPEISRAKSELNDLESLEIAIIAILYNRGGYIDIPAA